MLPHLDAAYNFARWLVGDPTLAEDVVQDATVRALRYFGSFRGDNARAWLLQIVRNAAHEARAKRQLHAAESLDCGPEHGGAHPPRWRSPTWRTIRRPHWAGRKIK